MANNDTKQQGQSSARGFAGMDEDKQKEIASKAARLPTKAATPTSSLLKRLVKQVARVAKPAAVEIVARQTPSKSSNSGRGSASKGPRR